MKKPIFLAVCLAICIQATLGAIEEDHGFLSHDRGYGINLDETEEGFATIVQPAEVSLTEEQIENGEAGCFTKYAYGNNIKDFGLSSASVSCPNAEKYKLERAECNVVGSGRQIASYSHLNFHSCTTQGAKRGGYHRTVVSVRCCSV